MNVRMRNIQCKLPQGVEFRKGVLERRRFAGLRGPDDRIGGIGTVYGEVRERACPLTDGAALVVDHEGPGQGAVGEFDVHDAQVVRRDDHGRGPL